MSLTEGLEHVVRKNEPLAPYTRLKLGGVAEFFAEPTSEDELIELVKRFGQQQMPIRLIGEGSNIVVREEGVAGLVLRLSAPKFSRLAVDGEQLTCAGGTRLSHLVSTAVREGFSGPENLVGIPGTVGGALHVNTSAHGFDIGSRIQDARVLTKSGSIVQRDRDSLTFSYRQSSLDELVILDATFRFELEEPETLTRRMQKLWIVRRAAQPITEGSIYVFKDHGVEPASGMIEQCGLKGTRVGDVEVSDRDANTFVLHAGATAADVVRLIDLVKSRVKEQLGIEIHSAVEIW